MARRQTVGNEQCLTRLVVKHTFVNLELEEDAPFMMRRRASDPAIYAECKPQQEFKILGHGSFAHYSPYTPTTCLSEASDADGLSVTDRSPSPVRFRSPRAGLKSEDNRDGYVQQNAPTDYEQDSIYMQLGAEVETRTTLMVCNLSTDLTQHGLVDRLTEEGCRGWFDFVYLPMNLRTCGNFGYAFINCTSPATAINTMWRLEGFGEGEKAWKVSWSKCQGLTANIEHNRNSPLMHPIVPEDCRPALYNREGERVPFPPPTKAIRKPRIHLSAAR